MTLLRTCLLVTDDPDDHQAISEALSIVSENTIVLNILDSQKALTLLKGSTYRPDCIFLDLSMHGIRINTFLKAVKNHDGLVNIPTVVYGDRMAYNQIEENENLMFFDKDYEYSHLQEFLRQTFSTLE